MQCTPDFTECGQPGVPPTSDQEHVTYYIALLYEAMGISITVLSSWFEVHNMTTTSLSHTIPTLGVVELQECTATQKEMSSHTLDQYMMQSQLHYVITFNETTIIRWNVTSYASTLGKAPI